MYLWRKNLYRYRFIATLFLFFIGILVVKYTSTHLLSPSHSRHNPHTKFGSEIPRRIWQTWEVHPQDMDEETQRLSKSWTDLNPEYRYELLTSESALSYVQENFKSRPDIVQTFEKIGDGILRADLIRYLTLLADGGVYTDADTDCTRPIRDWIPKEFAPHANLVFGIEYDSRGGEIRGDLELPAQLCQWTLMAKPHHPVLQDVVDRVVIELDKLGRGADSIVAHSVNEVLTTTGPRVFTNAVLESLSFQAGRKVSYADISGLDAPKLIGDVLFMPISSFASGQDHSASKPWGNEDQLMSHHWRGFQGWKSNHQS